MVVCVSGSAHSALPTAAPSFALLSPPILCTAPCCPLHLCLPAPSLPPAVSVFQQRSTSLDPQLFWEGENCVVAAAVAVVVANYMRIQII